MAADGQKNQVAPNMSKNLGFPIVSLICSTYILYSMTGVVQAGKSNFETGLKCSEMTFFSLKM